MIINHPTPGPSIEFTKTDLRLYISGVRAELRRMEAALAADDGPGVHATATRVAHMAGNIAVARSTGMPLASA